MTRIKTRKATAFPYRWKWRGSSWTLLSRGEPTLDQVDESQLPDWIDWPIWK